MTSPRNYIYDFEKLFNTEMAREKVKLERGISYFKYKAPNKRIMELLIEYCESKGWEFTSYEKRAALARVQKEENARHKQTQPIN